MENLELYNAVRSVPPEAMKQIAAGRLKGMTDINPMWRIKKLTEQFGPCGIGWKYEITNRILERGANDEIAAFVDINLYYKHDGEWSDPIPGTGGSMFVASERSGLHTSDECFKMALTDAISVAAKALGVAANVYWDKDKTKYDTSSQQGQKVAKSAVCPTCGREQKPMKTKSGKVLSGEDVIKKYGGRCSVCHKEMAGR